MACLCWVLLLPWAELGPAAAEAELLLVGSLSEDRFFFFFVVVVVLLVEEEDCFRFLDLECFVFFEADAAAMV